MPFCQTQERTQTNQRAASSLSERMRNENEPSRADPLCFLPLYHAVFHSVCKALAYDSSKCTCAMCAKYWQIKAQHLHLHNKAAHSASLPLVGSERGARVGG